MIGTEIGCYRILEKLGQGGMGVVYKALDTGLDRLVAMKVLNPDLSKNPELVSRFRSEAKAQANLNHTNLATLYAFMVNDGVAIMVMEFVDGETFSQMIRRRGPIPEQEAVPMFRQALLGIGYAHRAGILHRDIKPSNLMLNKNGIVKVMDFGIAKVMGVQGMTRTGMQLGTLAYMSPEQIQNRNVDIRSDIYELGITLYEMLTGHLPFEADSEFQIMQDHVFKAPPRPTKYYPYIAPGIENVILKSVEKNPDSRFQTVEQFGAALEHPDKLAYTPSAAVQDDAETASLRAAPIPQATPPSAPYSPPPAPYAPPRAPAPSAPSIPSAPSHAAPYSAPQLPPTVPAPVPASYGGPAIGPTRVVPPTIVQPQTPAMASAVTPAPPTATAAPSAGSQKKWIIIGVCVLLVMIGGVAAYQRLSVVTGRGPSAAAPAPTPAPIIPDASGATPDPNLPPDVVPPTASPSPSTHPAATAKTTHAKSQPPPQPKTQPTQDNGQQLWLKAQAAYAQGHIFEPTNDCALKWAIEARKAGNPGGKALEDEIIQAYKEHVAQFYKQKNYPAALALVDAMLKFYPGNASLMADHQKIAAAANSSRQ